MLFPLVMPTRNREHGKMERLFSTIINFIADLEDDEAIESGSISQCFTIRTENATATQATVGEGRIYMGPGQLHLQKLWSPRKRQEVDLAKPSPSIFTYLLVVRLAMEAAETMYTHTYRSGVSRNKTKEQFRGTAIKQGYQERLCSIDSRRTGGDMTTEAGNLLHYNTSSSQTAWLLQYSVKLPS